MRPFEAARRVYLIFGAEVMNDEAADALLKDLEEPPPYAVIVLVADDVGPLSETIRSRCQPVPFRRLSEQAVAGRDRRALSRAEPERGGGARAGPPGGSIAWSGCSTRRRPSGERSLLELARAVYRILRSFRPRPRRP